MTVSFTVKAQEVQEMYRRNQRGQLELGEVNFRSYGAPRPTFQTLRIVGVTAIYEHEDTYNGVTSVKQVVDFEFEIANGRDQGARFRQPWITVTMGKKSILGGIWRATGLAFPKPGDDIELTDLIGQAFQAKLKSKVAADGQTTYTSLVNETFEAVEPDDAPAAQAQPARRTAPTPPRHTMTDADVEDPFSEQDEPGFD